LPGERDLPPRAHAERRALLLDAYDADFRRPGRGTRPTVPRRPWRVSIAAALTACGAAAIVLLGGNAATPQLAQAAIVRDTEAAVALAPGTILHEQALVSVDGRGWQRYELWTTTDDPLRYRVMKFGRELSRNGSAVSIYDAGTNTITREPATSAGPGPGPADLAAELRILLQSGQARVSGTATVDGKPAYRLILGPASAATPPATVYVDQHDYRPLLLDYSGNGGEVIKYQSYDYLPATAANLTLLAVTAQHPSASIVTAPANQSASTTTTGAK
jgi:outer membrane lipoprotein-sorting protein